MPIQKILLVDDSKTELHYLSDLLGKRGFAVRTAENGEDAMRRLGEEKPDLILMDVVMPGQNGFQLTRAITRDPRFVERAGDHVHQQEPGDRQGLGHAPGRRDYIVKPVDADRADGEDPRLRLKRIGPTEWPTSRPCVTSRAGSPTGCRRRAPSRAASPGWRSSAARAAFSFRCATPARSSPWRRWCRCRTATAGSSASPTCAATCTASSTWRAFSASRPPRPARDQARLVGFNQSLDINCVLLVDRLSGLRSESELTRDGDDGGERPSFVGARYRDASARVWQELSLVELAGNDLFLKIVG